MGKFRRFIFSIIVMVLFAIFSLLIVGMLTYILKWKSDKAMIGIILTYIVAGVAGGFCLSREGNVGSQRKAIEAFILGSMFMFLLIIFSYLVLQSPFVFSRRFLLIWMLVVCSVFVGICVKRKYFKLIGFDTSCK